MELEIEVGRQKIAFDREATAALYRETIRVPGSQSCGCVYCRNFAVQKERVFPAEFLRFLGELGIDTAREWEVYEVDFEANNPQKLVMYGGWFVFAGRILEGVEDPPEGEDGFKFWVVTSFPKGTLLKEMQLCAVQFLTRIPWVLEEIPGS
jgi:hypothetical protein